jgi:hypothetical protein
MRLRYKPATGIIITLVFSTFLCCRPITAARRHLPRFRDYPAGPIYRGKTHALLPKYKDAIPKSVILDGPTRKPDFAGHYIAIQGSCGTGCSSFGAMDAKTGEIYWFGHTLNLDEGSDLPKVQYRLTSRLLVLHCNLDEKLSTNGTYYYVLKGHRFIRLRYLHTKPLKF